MKSDRSRRTTNYDEGKDARSAGLFTSSSLIVIVVVFDSSDSPPRIEADARKCRMRFSRGVRGSDRSLDRARIRKNVGTRSRDSREGKIARILSLPSVRLFLAYRQLRPLPKYTQTTFLIPHESPRVDYRESDYALIVEPSYVIDPIHILFDRITITPLQATWANFLFPRRR